MRIHVVAAALTLVGALVLRVSAMGLVAIVFAISLVFVAELINTAIEAAVDLATEGYDPLAKIAKDVAAGAVLIAAMNAVVVAYLVLFDPAADGLAAGPGLASKAAPAPLTVVALGLTLLIVIVLKASDARGLVRARRVAERTCGAGVRRGSGARLRHRERWSARARAVHRRPGRTEPRRRRDPHDSAGSSWRVARAADRDRGLSGILPVVRIPHTTSDVVAEAEWSL